MKIWGVGQKPKKKICFVFVNENISKRGLPKTEQRVLLNIASLFFHNLQKTCRNPKVLDLRIISFPLILKCILYSCCSYCYRKCFWYSYCRGQVASGFKVSGWKLIHMHGSKTPYCSRCVQRRPWGATGKGPQAGPGDSSLCSGFAVHTVHVGPNYLKFYKYSLSTSQSPSVLRNKNIPC